MLDILKIASVMESHGFRNVRTNSEYMGVLFPLIAEGKAGLVKQTILVSTARNLDAAEAARIGEEFMKADKKARSLWVGKIFTYCVFAESWDEAAAGALVERVRKNDMSAGNFVRGGGGAIVLVNLGTKSIASYVPRVVGIKDLAKTIGDIGISA